VSEEILHLISHKKHQVEPQNLSLSPFLDFYPSSFPFHHHYMVKALPDGLTVDGARLLFGQAPKQNDTGVYEYVANNGVGTRKVEHNITVTGKGQWAKLLLYFAKI
jgi:hypothetical protein